MMEKGINFDAIKEMTVGELQKFEADYPNLFDLDDYLKGKKIDTEIDEDCYVHPKNSTETIGRIPPIPMHMDKVAIKSFYQIPRVSNPNKSFAENLVDLS